jgi:lipopolysaccharide transport system permease protein
MSEITTVVANRRVALLQLLRELWTYRGLVWAFSLRDLKVKYFQTVLGPLWVLLTPLITVGVMTFVFGLMVRVPSDGLPYLLFYLVAIVPWYAFLATFSLTMSSLEAHASLISKIYFPRLVIGLGYALNSIVDFLVGFVVAIIVAASFGRLSVGFVLLMPVLLFVQMAWALGLGLWLAPLNAKYRDVKHLVPLLLQLYYFASPILYPASVAPPWMQWLYTLNPLAVVVTEYRSQLNDVGTHWLPLLYAIVVSIAVLVRGAVAFMRAERQMVDVL